MKLHSFRLVPGQDLKLEIEKYAKKHDIRAGFIVTCVSGLNSVNIRMPGATPTNQDIRAIEGPLEVDSLVGTVSAQGSHLHITVSDKDAHAFGGHLKEGSLVRSTAEIVIGEHEGKDYKRVLDKQTGFKELKVTPIKL